MAKVVKIGFLGLGVVGGRLLEILRENQQKLMAEYGIEIIPEVVLVRDPTKARAIDLSGLRLTTDENELIENEEISILVECMGGAGTEQTRDILLRAMKRKKHIIMSSKKCLASYCKEILETAEDNGDQIRYDATVGGGIPICSILRNMAKGEEITGIYGILNSTSNYILSSIHEEGVTFSEAVEAAKKKGYTENDPSEDVDGWDAAYKLVILMNLGMNLTCEMKSIHPEPMKVVISDADQLQQNSLVKQVAFARRDEDNSISYYVGPCQMKADKLLARVNGNNNMILIESRESGVRAFYGQGSGAGPTASIMYDDLLDVLCNPISHRKSIDCNQVIRISDPEQFLI